MSKAVWRHEAFWYVEPVSVVPYIMMKCGAGHVNGQSVVPH